MGTMRKFLLRWWYTSDWELTANKALVTEWNKHPMFEQLRDAALSLNAHEVMRSPVLQRSCRREPLA